MVLSRDSVSMKSKWWVIEGVKYPVYVGLREKTSRIVRFIYLFYAFAILLLLMLESINVLPVGTTLTALTSSIIFEIVFRALNKGRITSVDLRYVRSLLKTLGGRIVRWSIPSENIPVISLLDNGLYMLLFLDGSKGLVILLFKPLIYYKVLQGKPIVKYKWVSVEENKTYYIGLARLTYPHVDLRNTNYEAIAKAIYLPAGIENDKLLKLIDDFEEITSKIVMSKGVVH